MIILGRFLIGINSGLNAGLAPMYLAEVSPINLRGAVGTVYQLVITISILVAQILGLNSLLGSAERWPTLLAVTIVPAIFQVSKKISSKENLICNTFLPKIDSYLAILPGIAQIPISI